MSEQGQVNAQVAARVAADFEAFWQEIEDQAQGTNKSLVLYLKDQYKAAYTVGWTDGTRYGVEVSVGPEAFEKIKAMGNGA